jgi:hypothetical protein
MVEKSVRFGIRSSSRPRFAGATYKHGRAKKGRRALGRNASFLAAPDGLGRRPASKRAAQSLDDNRWRGKGRKPAGRVCRAPAGGAIISVQPKGSARVLLLAAYKSPSKRRPSEYPSNDVIGA